jgi:hypothetical protein
VEIAKANLGRMETQLKHWGAKLDELAARAEEASAEVRNDYHKHIYELRKKHQTMQSKFEELRSARNDKWETFKSGIETAWNEFEIAFKGLKD